MNQLYNLGKSFRKRYIERFKLISPNYDIKQVYARSTGRDRTLVSAWVKKKKKRIENNKRKNNYHKVSFEMKLISFNKINGSDIKCKESKPFFEIFVT